MTQSTLFEDKPGRTVSVLVPYPVERAYDYGVPADLDLLPGDYVCVPLGNREIPGIVWGEGQGDVAPAKLKTVLFKYDLPPVPEAHRHFIDWAAEYTLSPRGSVLKMALSVPAALEGEKPVVAYKLALSPGGERALSPVHRKVLDVLADGVSRRPSEIADLAGCSAGVVKTMAAKGFLEAVEIQGAPPCRAPDVNRPGAELSPDQKAAAGILSGHVRAGQFKATLLDGVTGAGKTETYFEAVAEALRQDKQVLILLPEIALSNAFLDRFQSRFGCAPALWHSNLTLAQRKRTWRGVAQGETKVVVGARSALFLPYADLGLMIVDEEHDPAYKQEEGVIYHARDMAVVRAHLGKIPVVLVSATPSLETIHNAWIGRYEHLHLPDRFGGARLPDVKLIDLRADKPERQHFIAPTLKAAVEETLARGEQILLFLNRRGYAPLTLCRTCGHRMNCPRCSAWLVEHKSGGNLQCHHCGFHMRPPERCPECTDKGSLAVCGPGVERILEEVKSYFPAARTMLLASDTAESNDSLRQMIRDIRDHKVDIIIGTQIIAKGHHFPQLTCVGVIDADLGLGGGELRASERVYQLLHQVAGRAGREEKPGTVYLQTFMPEHRIMKAMAAGERDKFLEVEAFEREQAHMPPYSRLAGIIVSGRDERQVLETAKALGISAPQGENIQTFGPAPAPPSRLRGKYRHRLLVRADKAVNIQKTVRAWVGGVKHPAAVRVQVDIDPQGFM
ncbi:MAG: primosomal protein N' [Alphaproteobacteria bacterium]|nr:primosomal protein N' [Alphaproteobacteria bacterium]